MPDRPPPAPDPSAPSAPRHSYAYAAAAIAAATAIGLVVFPYTSLPDIAMLYLAAIAAASLSGRGPAVLAASLAVAAFDVCFVPPRFTFAVAEASHLLTFAVMFGAGLVISTLTGRLRRQEREARLRERDTAALLAFTRDIAAATTRAEVAAIAARHLEDTFGSPASVVPAGDDSVAIAIAGEVPPRVVEAFARQAGLAVSRLRAAAAARDADLRARTEELRSSLLSAVSHDLRTPLAVITGAATSLRDDGDRLSAAARAELVGSIVDDARRLERVLGNLLQLTRLESGLVPAREPIPVEELVGAALTRLEEALGDRAVALAVPSELVVEVDPVLFEQVLINLIDNAVKHGQPPLAIAACATAGGVELAVRDHGVGIPPEDAPRLFDKFARASAAPGAGLGLAVVRAIVAAHGGTIAIDAPAGGGARFRIVLPDAAAAPREVAS